MSAIRAHGRVVIALALWALVVFAVAAFVGAGETFGQSPNHASLVIDYGGGRVERYCVAFDEPEISGSELLERAGVPVVFSGFGSLGAAVCRIDDVGCSDAGNCFCQCRGADCNYWSYFTIEDGAWDYQNIGPSQRTLRNGDIDGWVWGNGRTVPPAPSLTGACAPATATPTRVAPQPSPVSTVAQNSRPPPVATQPPEQGLVSTHTPAASQETAEPSRTRSPIAVRREGQRPDDGGSQRARDASDGGGGVPADLIAFGIVAVLLTAGAGGLLVWGRARG